MKSQIDYRSHCILLCFFFFLTLTFDILEASGCTIQNFLFDGE